MSVNKMDLPPIRKEFSAQALFGTGNWNDLPSWIQQISTGAANTFSAISHGATTGPFGVCYADIGTAGVVGDRVGFQTNNMNTQRTGFPVIEFDIAQMRYYNSGSGTSVATNHDIAIQIAGAQVGARLEYNHAAGQTQLVFINNGSPEVIKAWRTELGSNFSGRKMHPGLRVDFINKTATVLMYGEEIETFEAQNWDFTPTDYLVRCSAWIERRSAASLTSRLTFGRIGVKGYTY